MEGKVCWDLYIDGLVISSDGNLLDALGAAIKVLLLSHQVALSSHISKYPKWNALAIDALCPIACF